MPDYINPPVEADASDLETDVYAFIQSFFPEWIPREGHLVVILTEAIMAAIAENRFLASAVPEDIMRFFGGLVGINPVNASEAVAATTWTMRDNAGYTVLAGTSLRFLIGGDDYAVFETTDDFSVPAGSTTTAAGAVILRAVDAGESGNGLATPPELLDILDYVDSVALVGTTSGGSDAEDTPTYLNRLSTRLQLLADRPILPRDFEIFATTLITGIERALVLDGFNPVDGTYNNERMITITALDAAGLDVVNPTLQEMKDLLEASREVNFVINTMAATRTAVTITLTVQAYAGWDIVALQDNIEEALTSYLSPSRWGQPFFGESRSWVKVGWEKIRYGEIFTVVNNIEGVNYVVGAVNINGADNTDLTLSGEAPLPAVNPTLNITVLPG